jgi:hypothetical protein
MGTQQEWHWLNKNKFTEELSPSVTPAPAPTSAPAPKLTQEKVKERCHAAQLHRRDNDREQGARAKMAQVLFSADHKKYWIANGSRYVRSLRVSEYCWTAEEMSKAGKALFEEIGITPEVKMVGTTILEFVIAKELLDSKRDAMQAHYESVVPPVPAWAR